MAAAADLEPLQTSLTQGFQKSTGYSARFIFGASGALARQIENGAPYDVYLSANDLLVKQLLASGHLLAESVVVYAQGRTALWSKSGKIKSINDLLSPAVLHVAIANPLHAPYGLAAQQALQKLGLWERLRPKIVYGENVQQTLQYAESGNADAAITAWSLVWNKGGILLPQEWHAPIRQTGAVVKESKHQDIAASFLHFLTGPEGKSLLARFGFN